MTICLKARTTTSVSLWNILIDRETAQQINNRCNLYKPTFFHGDRSVELCINKRKLNSKWYRQVIVEFLRVNQMLSNIYFWFTLVYLVTYRRCLLPPYRAPPKFAALHVGHSLSPRFFIQAVAKNMHRVMPCQ